MSSVLPSLICMASRRKHAQPGFLLQACTARFSAAICKHVRFSVTKRTGCRASSHIITSYVLKRNRKQANPKESRALFWVWAGRAGLKMPFFLNASLERHSCKSGSIPPLEIIPHRFFQQIRINLPAGNHPSQTFPTNQDAFPRWKSSLTDFSSKSGEVVSLFWTQRG